MILGTDLGAATEEDEATANLIRMHYCNEGNETFDKACLNVKGCVIFL